MCILLRRDPAIEPNSTEGGYLNTHPWEARYPRFFANLSALQQACRRQLSAAHQQPRRLSGLL